MKKSPFAERFALARFTSSGVIVDLESGNYFQLNPSAALICEALLDSVDVPAARSRVARELSISEHEAQRLVDELSADLTAPARRGTPQGSYRYFPEPDGYGLWHGERCVLRVDGEGLMVHRGADAPSDRPEALEPYLRAVAAKLLAVREITVLHASACRMGERVVAFAGVSGAGKTTTVRAFQENGASLISEDLIVLHPEARGAEVLVDGEPSVRSWAKRAAAHLAERDASPISSSDLRSTLVGSREPLAAMLFLDSERRTGSRILTRRLTEAEGLLALLTNNFLGAVDPEAWRRHLQAASDLSTSSPLFEARMPAGVGHLAAAARAYMSS
jgi:hypothetical protein